MRNKLIILLGVLIFMSCGKEKFDSTPSLKFQSVNTKDLHRQELLRFTFSFTDKEGDLGDSIYVEKIVPNCPASGFEQWYPIPSFPSSSNQSGEIAVTFGYNVTGYSDILGPRCTGDDTAVFRFVLRDEMGNTSDTVVSPPIIIYK
ncbi:MAG: hypothetical protein J5I50_05740 [Chitinophagaceae bacterium]|nr:hypothetical protein [Chitinophagaceae bacterium]